MRVAISGCEPPGTRQPVPDLALAIGLDRGAQLVDVEHRPPRALVLSTPEQYRWSMTGPVMNGHDKRGLGRPRHSYGSAPIRQDALRPDAT